MEIKKTSKQYDVIIVGSGAGGGMATKVLSEAGLKVAVVESGPYYDPANPDQMTQLKWHGSHLEEGQELLDLLVILTRHTEVGILMANLTLKKMTPILGGSDQECWVEEPITGEEFH